MSKTAALHVAVLTLCYLETGNEGLKRLFFCEPVDLVALEFLPEYCRIADVLEFEPSSSSMALSVENGPDVMCLFFPQ